MSLCIKVLVYIVMSHVFKFLSCVFAQCLRQLGTVALTYFLVLMLHSNSHTKVSLTSCWHHDLKFLSTAFSWCQFLQRTDNAHWLWLYSAAYSVSTLVCCLDIPFCNCLHVSSVFLSLWGSESWSILFWAILWWNEYLISYLAQGTRLSCGCLVQTS